MGNTVSEPVKPKVCLIPPLIRKRHARPICANEFVYFGRPAQELLGDFLNTRSLISTEMVLKPQIRLTHGQVPSPHAPEVAAFLEGLIQPEMAGGHMRVERFGESAAMRLALEARWRNQLRALLSIKGSETKAPEVYLGFGRENLKGLSFYATVDPRPDCVQGEAGITQAFQYGTVGLFSSFVGRDKLPLVTAWAAMRPMPAIAVGANVKLNPTPEGFDPDVDFALNIRDPDAIIYDRPSYEISLKALSKGKTFLLSYFQHFVTRRRIYNPTEEKHVTHITNYIDVGAEVAVEKEKLEFAVGGSWQLNKNNLLKARLSHDAIQSSYVFKTWANPSFIAAFNAGYSFKKNAPQYGLSIICEASLGDAEFERAGANYEQVQVVRYGAEQAPPEFSKYDMVNDRAPVLREHLPVRTEIPQTVVMPNSTL